jgi:hypothetical protein
LRRKSVAYFSEVVHIPARAEVENLTCAHRLPDSLRERLAFLAGKQATKLCGSREDLIDCSSKNGVPRGDARLGPWGKRSMGSVDGRPNVV